MNIYSARYISSRDKKLILTNIQKGYSISKLSREWAVSRTSLYKWSNPHSATARNIARIYNPLRISALEKRRILKLALKHPNYPIRQLSSRTGMSVGLVWLYLKRRSLNTSNLRTQYKLRNGLSIYNKLNLSDKLNIINRFKEGESAVKICREYDISRTIFYIWIKKYIESREESIALVPNRPRGKAHWRFIKGVNEAILSIIAKNPELSISRLHLRIRQKHKIKISRSGLYYACKRLNLNTYEKRMLYSQTGKISVTWEQELLSIRKPVGIGYNYLSPLAPPLWKNINIYLHLVLISFSSYLISVWILVLSSQISNYYGAGMIVSTGDLNLSTDSMTKNKQEEKAQWSGEIKYDWGENKDDIIYITQVNDSLWHISEKIFESGYNWVDIAKINNIQNPDLIYVNQKLIIPVTAPKDLTTK